MGREVTPISRGGGVAPPISSLRSGVEPLDPRASPLQNLRPPREELERLSASLRGMLLRLRELESKGLAWHMRSALTSLKIVAVLYGLWAEKSAGSRRFVVVSKGHCSMAVYAWLAETGAINGEELERFASLGSRLQAHPEARTVPGIVVSSGSLGQGLSIANGIALAGRLKGEKLEVAVIMGDGELDEGQVWEAAATAAAYGLEEVIAVIDRNLMQHTGPTELVKPKEPLREKWRSFGWNVLEVENNVESIAWALNVASTAKNGRPTAVIVYTGSSGFEELG
ncbi:MAG: thiamine pyrophosphate-dependent enzyme [Fervidicoccaceae archaeon]